MRTIYGQEDFQAEEAAQPSGSNPQDVAQDAQGQQEAPLEEPWFPSFDDACETNVAAKEHFQQNPQLGWGNSGEHGIQSALIEPQNWYYGMFGALPEDASEDPTERLIEAGAKLGYHVAQSQGFDDANKRTARALVESFFENNGLDHIIPEGHDDEEYADHLLGYGIETEPGQRRHSLEETMQMFKDRHARGGPDPDYEPYPDNDEHFKSANILDPIHDQLDPRVWEDAAAAQPRLREEHSNFLFEKIYTILEQDGYDGMEEWLSLVFTGSLTTYQYSEDSDVDISLFVDVEVFPDWSRAEMIGLMIHHVDGTKLPGTPFPIQAYVVPPDFTKEMLYQPGLRSGYDISTDTWIVPPDRSRVHDVEREMNESYTIALENADKMEKLLRYEPDKAIMFWHQIHKRRSRDMKKGKGDYSPSNITYKMLANRKLFPQISEVSGEYIA